MLCLILSIIFMTKKVQEMRTAKKKKTSKNRFKSLSKTKAMIFSCLLNVNLPQELAQIIVIKLPRDYNDFESFIENSSQMF